MKLFIKVLCMAVVLLLQHNYGSALYSGNYPFGWCGYSQKMMHITFDDGPVEVTTELLDALDTLNVKATFFVLGKQARVYSTVIQDIVLRGHELASHAWSHKSLMTELTAAEVNKELEDTKKILEEIVGNGWKMKLFRPPYGELTQSTYDSLLADNITVVSWGLDTKDFLNVAASGDNGDNMVSYVSNVESSYQNQVGVKISSSIILGHDRSQYTAVVTNLVNHLRNSGYTFVSYNECLAQYEADGSKARVCVPECGSAYSSGNCTTPYSACHGSDCDPGCSFNSTSSCNDITCPTVSAQCTIENVRASCAASGLVCGVAPSCPSLSCGDCGYGECASDQKSCIPFQVVDLITTSAPECLPNSAVYTVANAPDIKVTFNVTSSWIGGFMASFSVKNTGSTDLTNVVLGYEEDYWLPNTLEEVWSGHDWCRANERLYETSDPSLKSILIRYGVNQQWNIAAGTEVYVTSLQYGSAIGACVPTNFRILQGSQVNMDTCTFSTPPTPSPTSAPSNAPSELPSSAPSELPSSAPSELPSSAPSELPSSAPSELPSSAPSELPSSAPSELPSSAPSELPSSAPSELPSSAPSELPSSAPSELPSSTPSELPSVAPSELPSVAPSELPSSAPSELSSSAPSELPSSAPSELPSSAPTHAPTTSPTPSPTPCSESCGNHGTCINVNQCNCYDSFIGDLCNIYPSERFVRIRIQNYQLATKPSTFEDDVVSDIEIALNISNTTNQVRVLNLQAGSIILDVGLKSACKNTTSCTSSDTRSSVDLADELTSMISNTSSELFGSERKITANIDPNFTDVEPKSKPSGFNFIIVLLIGIAVVGVLISCIFVKRCCKNSSAERMKESVDLENNQHIFRSSSMQSNMTADVGRLMNIADRQTSIAQNSHRSVRSSSDDEGDHGVKVLAVGRLMNIADRQTPRAQNSHRSVRSSSDDEGDPGFKVLTVQVEGNKRRERESSDDEDNFSFKVSNSPVTKKKKSKRRVRTKSSKTRKTRNTVKVGSNKKKKKTKRKVGESVRIKR